MDIQKSGMLRLDVSDLGKGLVTAVGAGAALAALAVLQSVFSVPGFDVFAVDWGAVMHLAVNASIVGAEAGFSGYIVKNFFSTSDGKFLGRIG